MIDSYECDIQASDFLEHSYKIMLEKYTPNELIYANGPGSFMGIKLAYVFLKTLSIVYDIPFYAISGFDVSDNGKIKANKMFCFIKDDAGNIQMTKDIAGGFILPKILPKTSKDNLPFYFLPALN